MDITNRARFLESTLCKDLKAAFQSIVEEKIKNSPAAQETEISDPYYYMTKLPRPFHDSCWCTTSPDDQCRPVESCPGKPRPLMGVNMRLAVCNRDHDEDGACYARGLAVRDCFNPQNVADAYFRDVLSRRSEPRTPWPQAWKERVTVGFDTYRLSDRVYDGFVNAVCALVEDMLDPFAARNAGWVPHVHGILGWYGQPAEYCIEELVLNMGNARTARWNLERPRRNTISWFGPDERIRDRDGRYWY